MFFILLNNFSWVTIILYYFFIRTSCKENVLLAILRMKLYTKRSFFIRKSLNNFPGFSIPQMNVSIIGCAYEFPSIIWKANIFDCSGMASISPQTFSICRHIPNFTCSIMTGWQHQMTIFWEKPNSLNTFIMSDKCMYPFLWNIVLSCFILCLLFKIRCGITKLHFLFAIYCWPMIYSGFLHFYLLFFILTF